ncbi:MAG: nuclear transport factor 2 family protein [Sphingomonas sp.]
MSAGIGLQPWFDDYLAAFNRADFPAFGAFHADDVILQAATAQVTGRDAVLDFYRKVRSYLDERVDLLCFVGAPDESRIAAELRITMVAQRDWPDMPAGPMLAGDTRQSVAFAIYDIAGCRITRIRTARFSQSLAPAA